MNKRVRNRILRVAFEYVMILGNWQRYKIQFMAIKEYYKKSERRKLTRHNIRYYTGSFSKRHEKDSLYIRDFLYKNDYMTPRMAVLIQPKMYMYYTVQTFMYVYKLFFNDKKVQTLDFSTKHVKVFYGSFLKFSNTLVKRDASYQESYRQFQEYRARFKGNRVLKIDIQNFFIGITVERLQNVLKELCKSKNINAEFEIDNIIKFFQVSGYYSLPQTQSSVASSILSQIYLVNFTNFLEKLAIEHNLRIVRYVDDMYFELPKNMRDREVFNLINLVSSELWKYGLNLNQKKVKLFSVKQYTNNTNFIDKSPEFKKYGSFLVTNYVQKKVDQLLDNNGRELLSFLEDVKKVWEKKGNDLTRYKKLVNQFFSIENDDANKVLNSIIFGESWKNKLNNTAKRCILSFPEIIGFDPAKYVTFLTLVETNIKSIDKSYQETPVADYIKKMHKVLGTQGKMYTIRHGMIDANFYLQNKKYLDHSDKDIRNLNLKYIEFIYRYICPPTI